MSSRFKGVIDSSSRSFRNKSLGSSSKKPEVTAADIIIQVPAPGDQKLYSKKSLHHRVDRVLGLFSSRLNWDPPPPHPQTNVSPPLVPGMILNIVLLSVQ
jgi:hypothetical protein